jgi:DNA-binding NarL/FixJ family response regulator
VTGGGWAGGAGGRVLIADDDATVREAARSVLSAAGHVVVGEASDGLEAVALADVHLPDVVILDLRMPLLDGQEATTRIRRRHPRMQVVVMSAFEDPESVRRCLAAGAAEYVSKGTGAAALREAVARAAAIARLGGSTRGTGAREGGRA